MISVIYAITNIINDKQYVGQAINKDKRWRDHKIMLNAGKHSNRHLQFAYNKYGIDNFIYTVLEIVDVSQLTQREQYWIDTLNTIDPDGYNLNPSAASALGFKHSEETKLKWSQQRKGKKRSAEFSLSVSKRMKGKVVTKETRERQRLAHLGKTQSEETKAKRAEKLKGNRNAAGVKQTADRIEARAVLHRGKPKSDEHKAKIAAGNKGKFVSEETKLKQSIAAKERRTRENLQKLA